MNHLRFKTVVLVFGLIANSLFAQEPRPLKEVDLNAEGAIAGLHLSNPAHYEKIAKIVEGLPYQPDHNVPRWLMTNFNATNAGYSPFLRMSYPPKRGLSFVLDDTLYNMWVTEDVTASRQHAVGRPTYWDAVFPPRPHVAPSVFKDSSSR